MSDERVRSAVARRSFLSRLGVGTAGFGAIFGLSRSAVAAQAPAAGPWQPARHAEDDWLDQPAAKHRFFLDTTTVATFGHAIFWSNNYLNVSRTPTYGLTDADSAVVICARHEATPFAFNDAMWAKYGEALAEHALFTEPKTKQAPSRNLFQVTGYDAPLPNRNVTLDALAGRGVRFAICALATRAIAGAAARKTGGKVDDILKELTENRVTNGRLVPAGIVAVNRAQERGYSISSVL